MEHQILKHNLAQNADANIDNGIALTYFCAEQVRKHLKETVNCKPRIMINLVKGDFCQNNDSEMLKSNFKY